MTGNGNELDEILAETQEPTTTETQEQTEARQRDEQGRFAAKAVEAEAANTEPAKLDTPTEQDQGRVPQQALHASREKEREAKQEAEALRNQLAQVQGQIDLLTRQLTQRPQQQQEPAEAKDFWSDPDGFVQGALNPVQQQMQQQAERFSMRLAVKEHGADTVQAAYSALGSAMQAGNPTAQAEYARIKSSDDPYEDIVQWHKRQQTLQMVGNDPNAWLEAELEKRLADPVHQGKILERIQGTAAANVDRSNPVTKLPPSLNRLPSGGSQSPGSMTDEALFSHALR